MDLVEFLTKRMQEEQEGAPWTSALPTYLLARYAEEQAALEQIQDHSEPWRGQWAIKAGTLYTYNGWCLAALMVTDALSGQWRPGVLEHIVRHDPARTAADLEAKRLHIKMWLDARAHLRAALARLNAAEDDGAIKRASHDYAEGLGMQAVTEELLRIDARAYVERKDFDPAWGTDGADA